MDRDVVTQAAEGGRAIRSNYRASRTGKDRYGPAAGDCAVSGRDAGPVVPDGARGDEFHGKEAGLNRLSRLSRGLQGHIRRRTGKQGRGVNAGSAMMLVRR